MTFHPNFRNNRKLYVWFSRTVDSEHTTSLMEIETMASDGNRTDLRTIRYLLDIEQPFGNHNGGDVS